MVERAKATDLGDLLEFERETFDYDQIGLHEFYNYIHQIDRYSHIYVMREAGKLTGYGIVKFSVEKGLKNKAWIYSLASKTKKAYLILQELEHISCIYGKSKIYLEVKTTNQRAIDFYTRNGYKQSITIRKFYDDGSDAVRFYKNLAEERNGE